MPQINLRQLLDLSNQIHQSLPTSTIRIGFKLQFNSLRGDQLITWINNHESIINNTLSNDNLVNEWNSVDLVKLILDTCVIDVTPKITELSTKVFMFRIEDSIRNEILNERFHFQSSFINNPSSFEPHEGVKITEHMRTLINKMKGQFMDEMGIVDFEGISKSDFYQEYMVLTHQLQCIKAQSLNHHEKLAFYANIYNCLLFDGYITRKKTPNNTVEILKQFSKFKYNIGGYYFTLNEIEHGILRGNARAPYSLSRQFSDTDPRMVFIVKERDPRIHFILNCGAKSCPPIGKYSSERIEEQLEMATRSFLNSETEILNDGNSATIVCTSKILDWYSNDFGEEPNSILKFISKYHEGVAKLDIRKVKLLFKKYDWQISHTEKEEEE